MVVSRILRISEISKCLRQKKTVALSLSWCLTGRCWKLKLQNFVHAFSDYIKIFLKISLFRPNFATASFFAMFKAEFLNFVILHFDHFDRRSYPPSSLRMTRSSALIFVHFHLSPNIFLCINRRLLIVFSICATRLFKSFCSLRLFNFEFLLLFSSFQWAFWADFYKTFFWTHPAPVQDLAWSLILLRPIQVSSVTAVT